MEISDNIRKQMVENLKRVLLDVMFGDGLELDYVMDGMSFEGLNNIKNKELFEMYESHYGSDDDLIMEVRANKAIKDMLTKV